MSNDHGQIEEQYAAMMNSLGKNIDEFFNGPKLPGVPRKTVFVLLVAETGKAEGGRVNYISNGYRAEMRSMLKEFLGRIEGRVHETPAGEQ